MVAGLVFGNLSIPLGRTGLRRRECSPGIATLSLIIWLKLEEPKLTHSTNQSEPLAPSRLLSDTHARQGTANLFQKSRVIPFMGED